MDWVDKPQNCKDLYGVLQLLRFSHLNNFKLKTLKLGRVAFHSVTFQLECLDFQSDHNIRNSSQSSHVSAMANSFWPEFSVIFCQQASPPCPRREPVCML